MKSVHKWLFPLILLIIVLLWLGAGGVTSELVRQKALAVRDTYQTVITSERWSQSLRALAHRSHFPVTENAGCVAREQKMGLDSRAVRNHITVVLEENRSHFLTPITNVHHYQTLQQEALKLTQEATSASDCFSDAVTQFSSAPHYERYFNK